MKCKNPNKDSKGRYVKKAVDLTASGYEWICPICDYVHEEIGCVEEVYCKHCDAYFDVYNYHHVVD